MFTLLSKKNKRTHEGQSYLKSKLQSKSSKWQMKKIIENEGCTRKAGTNDSAPGLHWQWRRQGRLATFIMVSFMRSSSPGTVKFQQSFMLMLDHVWLSATLWTVAGQAPLSMGFSRQEYWSGFHSLLQGIFPTQESNPGLLHCRQILYGLSQSPIQISPESDMGETQEWLIRRKIPLPCEPVKSNKLYASKIRWCDRHT